MTTSEVHELYRDIRRYQQCEYVHPLTCRHDSEHASLVPFIDNEEMVRLLCVTCGDITWPPQMDFKGFISDVSKSFNP
jgi:hypothetical protein